MCLIFLSFNQHPEYPLIIAANRDEFFDRPAAPMRFWPDYPHILAGKDLTGGGTWLGVTRNGYFALLTNYRDGAGNKPNAPSRGKLVLDYLTGEFAPAGYLQALHSSSAQYNGYNIILGTLDDPWYYANQSHKIYQLGTGLYGLSNALLDDKWPKVVRGKEKFKEIINRDSFRVAELLDFMHDKTLAADELLPDTGIGYEKEKLLSSMFIEMPEYGTRNTTVLLKSKANTVQVTERTYHHDGGTISEVNFNFSLV